MDKIQKLESTVVVPMRSRPRRFPNCYQARGTYGSQSRRQRGHLISHGRNRYRLQMTADTLQDRHGLR